MSPLFERTELLLLHSLPCSVCLRELWLSCCNLPRLSATSRRYHTSAMNHRVCLCLLMHFSINHSVLYNTARVRYTIELRVFSVTLFQIWVCRKCCRKFQCTFPGDPVPSRQNIYYLASKLKTTGSLLDKKSDRKWTVLTEETLDDTGARLETSPRVS
jgi:hypothetical protein